MLSKTGEYSNVGAVVLAAGMGTRMNSSMHKVLHPVGNVPMLEHVLSSLDELSITKKVVVVGAQKEQIEDAIVGVEFAEQKEQLGTGHAVLSTRDQLANFSGDIIILYGDVPLITPQTIAAMIDELNSKQNENTLVVLGFEASDPASYGRLVQNDNGGVEAIVEFKDADEATKKINLCNSGIMAVRGEKLFALLDKLSNENAAGEYYLTDLVSFVRGDGEGVGLVLADEDEVSGVNSRVELAKVEGVFQQRMREKAMTDGVTLLDPNSVYFSHDTKWAADVTIAQNVVIGRGVELQSGANIHAFSHLEGTTIGQGANVGPFARLRPGAQIGEDVKIGNFVEVKKSNIEKGAKVSHLSYIGDSNVGEGANIGAGTITCNYDGFNKFKTNIGAEAFIGSNTSLVAPVSIGDGATVAAGSVITSDVEADDLGIERSKQRSIKGWSQKFRSSQGRKK